MDYRKKFILIYQHHYFVNYTQIDMQKLNYNYRSDVTYIATLDLLLGAFQLRVTLLLSKFLNIIFATYMFTTRNMFYHNKKIIILF